MSTVSVSYEAPEFEKLRDTQVGLIPREWQVVPLGRVTQPMQTRDPRKNPDEVFRYIDVSSVSNESCRITEWKEIEGSTAKVAMT